MKIFKILFFILLIGIIGFSIFIAVKDGSYDVSTSRTMQAPAEAVYAEITDFKNWKDWDPIFESDATVRSFYPEKTTGVGGSFSWMAEDGNGTIENKFLEENKTVIQKLTYKNASPTEIYWNINPQGADSIEVVCGMRGTRSFFEKAIGFMTNDIGIKHSFLHQNGLELLDAHLQEELIKHSFKFKGVIDHGGGFYLHKKVSNVSSGKVSEKVIEKLSSIKEFMANKEIYNAGKPFRMLNSQNTASQISADFSVGIPVSEHIDTNGAMAIDYMKPCRAIKMIFRGDYRFIQKAWNAAFEELANINYKPHSENKPFETYLVGKEDTGDPSKWITAIYIPLAEKTSAATKSVELLKMEESSFEEGL